MPARRLAQSEALRFSLTLRCAGSVMPVSRRYLAPGQFQFITPSVYRRLKLFDSYHLPPVAHTSFFMYVPLRPHPTKAHT